MPRETKMERLERENRHLREQVESKHAWALSIAAERDHLAKRCNFLYEQGLKFAEEAARERLDGPKAPPFRGGAC